MSKHVVWVAAVLWLAACGGRSIPSAHDTGPPPDHGAWLDGDPAICWQAADCAGYEYCDAFGCNQAGVCRPRPSQCDALHAPVCGCDTGQTYGNRCEAHRAGAVVDYEGPCKQLACKSSLECGPSSFCNFPAAYGATCGAGGEPGFCELRPLGCPTIYSPVCGCDGLTYGNACEAHAAGVADDYGGSCPGGQANCEKIVQSYVAALDKAKQCAPMLGVEQCTALVPVSLPCGCDTFINGLDPDGRQELDQLTAQWKQLACTQYPWACPEMPCAAANHASCGPQGRCQDD